MLTKDDLKHKYDVWNKKRGLSKNVVKKMKK